MINSILIAAWILGNLSAIVWLSESFRYASSFNLLLVGLIITPYSSTIVLVNDEQRKMLKEAEAASDRFDREVETGVENLNQPFSPTEVSGVPEPEEWMLLGIAAIGLIVIYRLRKRTKFDR